MPARMIIAVLVALLIPIPAYTQDIISQLIEAARNGRAEKVQALLEAGADVNAKTDDGSTALMMAAFGGQTETAQVLLDAGADVNAKNNDGQTALWWAARQGHTHTEIVELLKQAGAKE